MAKVTANMPVKVDGKIVPAHTPFECDRQDAARLRRAGVLTDASATHLQKAEDRNLEETLAELISEGVEITTMTMDEINALLPVKVKRAEVNAALESIKSED